VFKTANSVKTAIATVERCARKHAIRAAAKKVYRDISSDPAGNTSGSNVLTRAEKRAIKRYASRIFGSSAFAPWLYTYTLFAGEFRVGWLPDDFFGQHLIPTENSTYRNIAGARTLTRRLILGEGIPDLAYRVRGLWFDRDYREITFDKVRDILFAGGTRSHVFLKTDMSSRGRGVRLVSIEEFEHAALAPAVDLVAQAPVQQAPWFAGIYRDAVATIRLTTAFTAKRKAHLRASYLRIGRGDSRFISGTFLRWPVVDENGGLAAYAATESWHRVATHPDTGFSFAEKRIPHFADALQYCLDLHARIPQFMVIGWDVAVCERGRPNLLEWNAIHPGISFSEASTGPNFLDIVPKIHPRGAW
jgi:hypothetical protein